MKYCRNCGKKLLFYSVDITTWAYKDEKGYYCSYNCYRKKSVMKDDLLNLGALGEEKEKRVKELTYIYYLESGDNFLTISNYKAINDICSQEDFKVLFKDKDLKDRYIQMKALYHRRDSKK